MSRRSMAWLPNAFTAANVALGFLSIIVCVDAVLRPQAPAPGQPPAFDTACWLILWATIFDVLDGKVAKLTGSTSDFGMRLDTFADATTFGLAPAVLIFCTLLSPERLAAPLGWLACAAYFTAAIFRLARYNVLTGGEPSFGFVGLPTPAAALISVSLYLSTRDQPLPAPWVALLMLLIGVVMVSPLRYPAFKGLFPIERNIVMAILASMALFSIIFGPARVLLAYWGSFALVWGYLWVPTRHRWVPQLRKATR